MVNNSDEPGAEIPAVVGSRIVGATCITIDPESINPAATSLQWKDECVADSQDSEMWPDVAAEMVVQTILTWARYGPTEHLEVTTLRDEQLVAAGHAWSQSHSSPTIMIKRLSVLAGTVRYANRTHQLLLEQAIRCVTVAAANDTFRQLQDSALLDPLTRVGNRRALQGVLRQALTRSRRHLKPLCVVAVDLDGLKQINDHLGHPAGDTALVGVVESLKTMLRQEDSIFRVGGDEFVLLFPDTRTTEVVSIMNRVVGVGAPAFSWGISEFPKDATDSTSFLAAADQNLYARRAISRGDSRNANRSNGAVAVLPESSLTPVATQTTGTWIGSRWRQPTSVAALVVLVAIGALAVPAGVLGQRSVHGKTSGAVHGTTTVAKNAPEQATTSSSIQAAASSQVMTTSFVGDNQLPSAQVPSPQAAPQTGPQLPALSTNPPESTTPSTSSTNPVSTPAPTNSNGSSQLTPQAPTSVLTTATGAVVSTVGSTLSSAIATVASALGGL